MTKATKTQIPADLREIKTLTLDEIEKVNALRRDRRSIQTRLDNLPKKKEEYEADIKKNEAEEQTILDAARAKMPPPAPPAAPTEPPTPPPGS